MHTLFPLTDNPNLYHSILEGAALTIGTYYYRWLKKREGVPIGELLNGGHFAVIIGCILGAAIGNKLMFWIEMPQLFTLYWNKPEVCFAGQSMVGGLLGGLIGVEVAKKLTGITSSTGDSFVFPILLGLIIGRVGCFISGLKDGTYGVPTALPWGIDFGDGIPRHPTQLYEILFAGTLWLVLNHLRAKLAIRPGLLFKTFLCSYLLWRLLIDALKPLPFDFGFGLSGIQCACAIALFIYIPASVSQWKKLQVTYE
jgi:prolipoprotein diacylglyceryltransferase